MQIFCVCFKLERFLSFLNWEIFFYNIVVECISAATPPDEIVIDYKLQLFPSYPIFRKDLGEIKKKSSEILMKIGDGRLCLEANSWQTEIDIALIFFSKSSPILVEKGSTFV